MKNKLLDIVNKVKPTFSEGGKFPWLHSTFDAFETFMFVPSTTTKKGSHVRDCVDCKRLLIIVVLALLPAFCFGTWNIGDQHSLAFGLDYTFWQKVGYGLLRIIPLFLVSYIVGLGIEFAGAQIKGEEVSEGYLVTGFIIPLIVPVDIPLWTLALAVAFATIIGKEVFGGSGMNIWNPALLARAFLFFGYPTKMTGDAIWTGGVTRYLAEGTCWFPGEGLVDGWSGATPLTPLAENPASALSQMPDVWNLIVGNIGGAVGETSIIAILIGAVILVATGIASWKIMVSSVLGALAVGYVGFAAGITDVPCYYQLLLGGFAFGTVFMATDPVTSAQTECGKWIYGFLIGALCVTVRLFNPGYPEGMMLAILFMNTMAPLIDHVVVERSIKRHYKKLA